MNNQNYQDLDYKKTLLIVDDDEINGDIISSFFENEFSILRAFNGEEALKILFNNLRTIDLVLLDIFMPVFNGFEVLKERQNNPALKKIPFIVMTSEKEIERECFRLGVNDFIRKPFENPDIIVARVNRMIELYQDRSIIKEIKRDKLTNLYSEEFFKLYANQFDTKYQDLNKDLLSVNISKFHLLNERYGKAYADTQLIKIASYLKSFTNKKQGVVGRIGADIFILYCAHLDNYDEFINGLNDISQGHYHMRVGIYQNVEKGLDIDIAIGRSLSASDLIKNDHNKVFAFYDDKTKDDVLFKEDLINSFDAAIKNKEFQIYYQPKYAIQGEKNILVSAEALIRWINPKYGFISPGVFILLFENNGLIQKLDKYVFSEVARMQAEWFKEYHRYIPISVNVSRIDIFNPLLVDEILKAVDQYQIPHQYFYIEITESAYADNTNEVIKVASNLKEKGFVIEIDDFGSGYSALNILPDLPFDVLKIDMAFVKKLDQSEKNRKLVKFIIELASSFNAKTVAEGCENEAQYLFLKEKKCDIIQGYYFSKPLPLNEFKLLIEKELKNL